MIKMKIVKKLLKEDLLDDLIEYIDSEPVPSMRNVETQKGMEIHKSDLVQHLLKISNSRIENGLSDREVAMQGITIEGMPIQAYSDPLYQRIQRDIESYIDVQTECLSGLKERAEKKFRQDARAKSVGVREDKKIDRKQELQEIADSIRSPYSKYKKAVFIFNHWRSYPGLENFPKISADSISRIIK
jgi:hypothetical protein